MPTVDQLAPATASTDTDELAVSQSGTLRKLTRAQLLASTQPLITLSSPALLGRQSAGVGGPETIAVGAGLALSNAVLSAAPTPISLTGIDASASVVLPDGATKPRALSSLLAAAVAPESFGAVGDGVTDDTAALAAALATLRPVVLGPRSYAVTGQWTIPQSATLFGAPGQSTLRRIGQQSGSAWISIAGLSFTADGIVFDANGSVAGGDTWSVLVTASCLQSSFNRCVFLNGTGPTLGNGLTILASDPAQTAHSITHCEAANNGAHGVWIQAVDGAAVIGNRAHDNAGYGLCLDYNDPTFKQDVRLALVSNNRCWNNQRGIAIGNFNQTNLQPPSWGNANPDAVAILVTNNVCYANTVYGIAVSGRALSIDANMLSANGSTNNGGAGILANCAYSRVCGNTVAGASQFGIDCGGSLSIDVSGNHVSGAAVGINPGGSQNVRVSDNVLLDNGWAALVYNVETDGKGNSFGSATTNLILAGNTVGLSSPSSGGFWLIDAPQAVSVTDNHFIGSNGATIGQCLWPHTDSAIVEGNRWNATQRLYANPVAINGLQTVQIPDIADELTLTVVPSGVQSMQTDRQLAVAGQIGFVKITSGGSGYTTAAVTISGSGTGAKATAYISNGAVIGAALTNPGSGYGSIGSTAMVTISGDGTGASATASVGLPVLEGRKLRVSCNVATLFARSGSLPFQDNWTLAPMTVPANATVTFTGTFGAWRADMSPLADYVQPPGDGSLLLRTQPAGDLVLRPATTGAVRLSSDADPIGCVCGVGHGSPAGVVAAPPGSDYRNLDGGAGQTLWVKTTGNDASGWIAIA